MKRKAYLRRAIPPLVLLLLAVLAMPGGATAESAEPLPFRDPQLALELRIDDLLGRLTLDEKISLLHQYQPAIPRLGHRLFRTGTEALHGVAWSNDLQQQLAVGDRRAAPSSRRRSAWPAPGTRSWCDRSAPRSATRLRGYHARDPGVWGLNLWAPVVNLLRDPRWGRNEEGYSEDPLLTGAMSTAYGKGMPATTRPT